MKRIKIDIPKGSNKKANVLAPRIYVGIYEPIKNNLSSIRGHLMREVCRD